MNTQNKKEVSVTEFKKHFLQLIEEVNTQKSSFTIIKRKVPVAQVTPLNNEKQNNKSFFGCMKGITKIKEDIVGSGFESEWDINND
jgi:antitoxin (DNA-binding transcriptional repressor) of toxin-antitoxin stability system